MATDPEEKELVVKLREQVEHEAAEIASAPRVEPAANAGRCHFCGAVTRDLRYVETIGGVERYKGVDCCG